MPELDQEIEAWEDLVQQYPQSRHALARLAELYRSKADLSQEQEWSHKAVASYIRAAKIGLSHGRIRYTRQISELLATLKEKGTLDQIFQTILSLPKDTDRDYYYLALVDYADGLAQLRDDQRAWNYFEEAIDFHPEQNLEAINRYARHLLDRKDAKRAFAVLDSRLTSELRARYIMPAYLRKEAMELLGMDTASADAETAAMKQRVIENGGSIGVTFTTPLARTERSSEGGLAGLFASLLIPKAEAFVHSNSGDDCRAKDYHTTFCDPYGNCFYPFLVNMGEVIDNEAKTETPGSRDTVGWTIKDRSFGTLGCDSYPGMNNACTTKCNHPNYCVQSEKVCCALHGGAPSVGQSQSQFNDGHVDFNTLVFRGTVYEAWYVLDGFVPDMSSGWIPPGVSGCTMECGTVDPSSMQTTGGPWCQYGWNYFDWPPNGPMEFRGGYFNYQAANPQCKIPRQNFCGNGGSENWYYGRLY